MLVPVPEHTIDEAAVGVLLVGKAFTVIVLVAATLPQQYLNN